MKKIYYGALILSLQAVSCQKDNGVEITTSETEVEVVVGVGFSSEGISSRVVVESDGMYGGSKYYWSSSDKLGGWSSDATTTQTELNQYSTFPYTSSTDEVEIADYTEFGGTASGNKLRLVYPYSDSEITDGLLPVSIEKQQVTGIGSYGSIGQYAVMISEETYTLDRKYYVEDVMMQHIGALLDLHLQFARLESSGVEYTLNEVQIAGVNSSGVINLSSSGISNALESTENGFITVKLSGYEKIENGKVYTVPVSILPTVVGTNDYILIKVKYTDDSFEEYSVTTVVENTTDYSVDFCRAQRHYLEVSIDTSIQNDIDGLEGLDGFGSKESPYSIGTAAQLSILAEAVADGDDSSGKYYKMIDDIDLGNNSWSAIGSSSQQFKGEFDGGGYEISGLYIDESSSSYQGLFGYLGSGGVVKDLGVKGSVVGSSYVGGIVGYNDSGTISSCYSAVTVSGSYYVGGIVGFNRYNSVTNCYNTGSVSGDSSSTGGVGGIVGYNNYGTISNCYNVGDVSGKKTVGGVVGDNSNGTITNCYRLNDCVINCGTETTLGSEYTTTTMQSSSFVTTLNAAQSFTPWSPDKSTNINNGYPILSWQ